VIDEIVEKRASIHQNSAASTEQKKDCHSAGPQLNALVILKRLKPSRIVPTIGLPPRSENGKRQAVE
jgi:hypothetical protein